MTPELDAVLALLWAGSVVRIHERFEWGPEAVPPDRPRLRYRLVSYFQMRLEGVGLSPGLGTLDFAFKADGSWMDYGIMMDCIERIEFPAEDRVDIVERLGPHVWRHSQFDRVDADTEGAGQG